MPHHEIKVLGGNTYLYEIHNVWDRKLQQSRKAKSVYLGPCDPKGNLLSKPKVQLEAVHSAFPVGAFSVFYAQARERHIVQAAQEVLGISREDALLLLGIVLNQLTGRVALKDVPEWLERTPLRKWESALPSGLTGYRVETVLGALCHPSDGGGFENQGLQLQMRLTREGPREKPGAFYDVTKVGYTGIHCSVAQMGLNSEKGISRVVGFGLVVSRVRHRPMLCQLLPGSRSDMITVEETLAILKEMEGAGGTSFDGMALSMDRGMVSAANLKRVVQAGFHQVGMVKDWPRGAWEYAGRWSGEALEKPEHTLCRPGGKPLYGRAFPGRLYERDLKVVLMEDPARKAAERRERDLALQELEGPVSKERLEEIKHDLKVQDPRRRRKEEGYVPGLLVACPGRRGFRVDPEAAKAQRVRDGRFLLFCTDREMEAREVFNLWSQRGAIESVFRTGKGDLMLGPLRCRSPDRLEAYATVVYLSWLLWSDAEWKLRQKYPRETLAGALRTLGDVHWVRLGTKKSLRDWTTALSTEQKELLSALGGLQYLPRP